MSTDHRTVCLRLFVGLVAASMLAGCANGEESSFRPSPPKRQTSKTAPLLASDPPSSSAAPCDSSPGIGPKANCDVAVVQDSEPPPAAGQPIKASLSVTRHPDTATFNNCLKIQVNQGPEIDLGCNHGPLVNNVQIDALAKPACNEIRLILFSNGTKNRTTESADNVAQDFRIERTATNAFSIQCNDNGDQDFDDLNLDIASDDATLSIENTAFGCEP